MDSNQHSKARVRQTLAQQVRSLRNESECVARKDHFEWAMSRSVEELVRIQADQLPKNRWCNSSMPDWEPPVTSEVFEAIELAIERIGTGEHKAYPAIAGIRLWLKRNGHPVTAKTVLARRSRYQRVGLQNETLWTRKALVFWRAGARIRLLPKSPGDGVGNIVKASEEIVSRAPRRRRAQP